MKGYEVAISLIGKVDPSVSAAARSAASSVGGLSARVAQLNDMQSKFAENGKLRESMEALRGKHAETQREVVKLSAALTEQKARLAETSRAYNEAKANSAALRDAQGAERVQLAELQAALKNETGDRAVLKAQIVKQREAVRTATEAYKEAVTETKAANAAHKEAASAVKETERSYKNAKNAAGKLSKSYQTQHERLRTLRSEMAKNGITGENFAKSQAKITEAAQKANAALAKQQSIAEKFNAARAQLSFDNFKNDLAPVLAYSGTVKALISSASEYESTMAGIRKVVDFDTPEQFNEMSKDLQQLSLQIPFTVKELGEIYASGGQSGIARGELLKFTETAAKMGIAFDVSADQAGEWMSKWRAALGISQDEVAVLADQINYLGNNTSATAAQISSIVSRLGALAKVGGVSGAQIAALGATIVGAGISEEQAATGIRNFMLTLSSGASASSTVRDALAQIQIDPEELASSMLKDPEKVMLNVIKRIAKVAPDKQQALLSSLFGSGNVNILAPLLSNIEGLRSNFALIKSGYGGSMEAEFESMAGTTENAFTLINNSADMVKQTLGTSLLPTVKILSRWVVRGAGAFGAFAQKFPRVTAGAVALAGALAGLHVLRTSLKYAKALISLPWYGAAMMVQKYQIAAKAAAAAQWLWNTSLSVGRALLSVGRLVAYKAATLAISAATKAWTAVQWLLNAALTANPIGLVVAAIGALIAAVAVLYNKFEAVRNVINGTWSALKGAGSAVLGFFKGGSKAGAPVAAANAAAHAEGGIFSRPHLGLVAERGRESIVPWNESGRSIWERTGEANGWSGSFSPSITINVNGSADNGTASTIAREVERVLRRLANEKARVSFA